MQNILLFLLFIICLTGCKKEQSAQQAAEGTVIKEEETEKSPVSKAPEKPSVYFTKLANYVVITADVKDEWIEDRPPRILQKYEYAACLKDVNLNSLPWYYQEYLNSEIEVFFEDTKSSIEIIDDLYIMSYYSPVNNPLHFHREYLDEDIDQKELALKMWDKGKTLLVGHIKNPGNADLYFAREPGKTAPGWFHFTIDFAEKEQVLDQIITFYRNSDFHEGLVKILEDEISYLKEEQIETREAEEITREKEWFYDREPESLIELSDGTHLYYLFRTTIPEPAEGHRILPFLLSSTSTGFLKKEGGTYTVHQNLDWYGHDRPLPDLNNNGIPDMFFDRLGSNVLFIDGKKRQSIEIPDYGIHD